jgi:GTP-binding protein HflX
MTRSSIVAKRADEGRIDTTEIRDLADAAGYRVDGEVTQRRAEDAGTHFGAGKVEGIAALVAETGADAVLVDGDLTPTQSMAIADACPEGTRVADRYRVVLDIFAERAETRRAQLQVELATLEYDLPRIEARDDPQPMNVALEKGTRLHDVRDRIDGVRNSLAESAARAAERRRRRREQGFSVVALAGYTNAGKSTLLHRLADDLSAADREADHGDVAATASVRDRLFETLSTTTRRATLDGRRTLVTDTVGLVGDLPHDLVESFQGTLSATFDADAVVLVVDAAASPERIRDRVETCRRVFGGELRGPVVPALNKADLIDGDALAARRRTLPDEWADPVVISAERGTGVDALAERVATSLPAERAELVVPNDDDGMSLISWLYDHAHVAAVEYEGTTATVTVEGRPEVVSKARSRAAALR